ncbi:MAG: DNA adenine methylase [Phycisphaerae bacterium]
MTIAPPLKAPFPYFGGKSTVAERVWSRLGDVANYIEPFFGSGVMLLRRPTTPKTETANDLDCNIANFWRATQFAPEKVAVWADWPVNEADLHARHRWLCGLGYNTSPDRKLARFRARIRLDPSYFDPRRAGWWAWGACLWIGSGWCGDWGRTVDGDCDSRRPHLSHRRNLLWDRGQIMAWLIRLRGRLRNVRVCCGDWSRICSSWTTTVGLGLTGVFLDPPYSDVANRHPALYAHDDQSLAHEVRAWCRERGPDPQMRIALCGYDGEHNELEASGWSIESWKTRGGYANQGKSDGDDAHRRKERIWFSPHCLSGGGLFE